MADSFIICLPIRSPDAKFLYATWGAAWLVGFGALFLAQFTATGPMLPALVGFIVGAGALITAVVTTSVHATRRNAGLRGPSSLQVAMHGNIFAVAFTFLGVLGWRLHVAGAPSDAMLTYWVAGSCLIVGVQFLSGAAIWNEKSQLIFGLWTLVLGVLAALAPAPFPLLVGVLGGAGFIVFALMEKFQPTSLSGPLVRGHND